MLDPLFSLPVELHWLMTQIKEEQNGIHLFVKFFATSFPCHDGDDPDLACERLTKILYAGLAPHFREELSMLNILLQDDTVINVRDEHFRDQETWRSAEKALVEKLTHRGLYRSNARRVAHDMLASKFFPNTETGKKDRSKAQLLFLAIWEMESIQIHGELAQKPNP